MLNREQFDLHKDIVALLTGYMSFQEAMNLISFAEKTDRTIPDAFIELYKPENPPKRLK